MKKLIIVLALLGVSAPVFASSDDVADEDIVCRRRNVSGFGFGTGYGRDAYEPYARGDAERDGERRAIDDCNFSLQRYCRSAGCRTATLTSRLPSVVQGERCTYDSYYREYECRIDLRASCAGVCR